MLSAAMLEGLPPHRPTHVLRLETDEERARMLTELLGEVFDPAETAVAAFEQGDGPIWLLEAYFASPPDQDAVRELARTVLGQAVDAARFDTVAETDWVAASLEGLKPIRAGRFLVHGAHDRRQVRSNDLAIEIEAALAFGTGHHGTTRGCLLALDAVLKQRRPRHILDVGTGTGVLAFAAARALKTAVVAGDLDPVAVAVARENARLNGLAPLLRAYIAPGVRHRAADRPRQFDVVTANILAKPLRRLAPSLARVLANGGTLIFRGCWSETFRASCRPTRRRGSRFDAAASSRAGRRSFSRVAVQPLDIGRYDVMTARFQTFDDLAAPSQGTARIPLLRAELARRGLDGFVVPRADEHQSEYVPANAERLAWLTGFTGSAGSAVILTEQAALVVDGRYTLQAAQQIDTGVIAPVAMIDTNVEAWIEAHLPAGARLGYDPWLHTSKATDALRKAAEAAGGTLVPVDGNPVDAVWLDRPGPPRAPLTLRPEALAGEPAATKLERLCEKLARERVDTLLVSDPHNLAWLFNFRGQDVAHTPLALGYGLVPKAGRPTLFIDPAKIPDAVGTALAAVAELAPPEAMTGEIERLGAAGVRIRLDVATAADALARLVESAGAVVDRGQDPITPLKAVKNAAEIAGTREAHRRDGAAVTRFLAWLASAAGSGGISEIAAVEALEGFRQDTGRLKDVSFPTISGSGPNGAIVHYRVTRATDRALGLGELFLVDSGAQYEDGTTDITRTVAIGEPSAEMRDRFTRVLKGHIAIARAVFPAGTSGAQLDGFARRPLWDAGLDFDHGTGHGVGSYLSVHEGPQRISKLGTAALEPGMIVSNEPGYYKTGAFGIRIENLVLVEPREVAGGERTMLGFETLTLAPIDLALVEPSLLDEGEIAWLDAYHARVRDEVGPLLDGGEQAWLLGATIPIAQCVTA
jgi:Xaa-Pro aminopeptidase